MTRDPVDRAVLEDDEPEGRDVVTMIELQILQREARRMKGIADGFAIDLDEAKRHVDFITNALAHYREKQRVTEQLMRDAEVEMREATANPTTNPNPEGTT